MPVKRTDWFEEARFGMFIHWGLYAIPARGEWVASQEKIPAVEYEKFMEEFNPRDYQPREWARLARKAGMKYAVMTAKHHDGFCLFDSQLTQYKSTNAPCRRDLIREYVEAFRAEGIRIGIYYSLLDWHHPDYRHYTDTIHPMRGNEAYKDKKHDFSKYLDYMHGQVKELLTNYGKIDIIWFDFAYDDLSGEAWRATELTRLVRSLQPEIIMDNRMGGDIKAENPPECSGDFASPELGVPEKPITNAKGQPIPWEECITFNGSWGYRALDKEYKSAKDIVRTLVHCASKGGNLIVNVGPTAHGEIPDECARILQDIGAWMKRNGESIYGCGTASLAKPDWGRYTQKEGKIYAHLLEQGIGQIYLAGLKHKIKRARLLSDGSEVFLTPFWNGLILNEANEIFMNFGRPPQETFLLKDPIDTVVELTLIEEGKS